MTPAAPPPEPITRPVSVPRHASTYWPVGGSERTLKIVSRSQADRAGPMIVSGLGDCGSILCSVCPSQTTTASVKPICASRRAETAQGSQNGQEGSPERQLADRWLWCWTWQRRLALWLAVGFCAGAGQVYTRARQVRFCATGVLSSRVVASMFLPGCLPGLLHLQSDFQPHHSGHPCVQAWLVHSHSWKQLDIAQPSAPFWEDLHSELPLHILLAHVLASGWVLL